MNESLLASAFALLLSLVAFVRSFQHSVRSKEMLSEKRDHVGRKYAVLGWSYARAQSETDLAKARKHAIEGFIIADTAIDGKRDFTDRQVAVYVDSTTPEAW